MRPLENEGPVTFPAYVFLTLALFLPKAHRQPSPTWRLLSPGVGG